MNGDVFSWILVGISVGNFIISYINLKHENYYDFIFFAILALFCYFFVIFLCIE